MGSVYEILSGAFFPGVGTATAQKLARHFGASLQSVLDKDSARALAGVVTEHKAELIVRGWRAYSAKRELEDWLREVGVDRSIADIAFKVWGLEAVQRIKANPYRLLAFLHWKAVDRVSLRAGVNASAQIRLTAGVEAAAYAFLEDDRSTWVAETELSARAAIMLGSDAETALVATALAESTGALIRLGFGYQVPGAYYAERYVEEWVSQRRLGIEPPEGWIQQFEVGLSAQQRIALRNAVRRSVSVFHGAAGTGITDTLRAICSTCVALGERPVLLAVTAKNARRLESTLGFTALNLEWALLNFDWDALSKPVVIVDEFVMVDLLSFRRLLRKIPGDARLVLCGDVNQLPSVGPGRLLHSFVFHGSAPVQILEYAYKPEDAAITAALNEVRNGTLRTLPDFDWLNSQRQGVFAIECSGDQIQRIVSRLYSIFCGNAQVVSALSRSRAGTRSLNRVLHRIRQKTSAVVPGTPVVFTRNARCDSGHHVVNGLQGVVRDVLSDRADGRPFVPYVCVDTDGGAIVCTRGEFNSFMELGYALTVDHAQGSQWDTVIAVLPKCSLLERSLVYTALGCCNLRCIVVTDDVEALLHAVRSESVYDQRQDRLFQLGE